MSQSGMNRRHFLKHVAGYSMLALPGIQFLRTIQANAQDMQRRNKSVIIMWMGGGPATIDIWDLKPGRPTGGEFRAVDTAVPGIRISEHMPTVARQMRNPAIAYPSLGAVAAHEIPKLRGYRSISLPAYMAVGGAGGGPGFLGMN